MPTLIMRRGPRAGAVYELNHDVVNIGRGSKNDIIIDDNDVSREHCRLLRVVDHYQLEDLKSTNGTFVNGQRVTQSRDLHSGELIELGEMITLEYQQEAAEQKVAPIPSHDPTKVVPINPSDDYALVVEVGPNPRRIYTLASENVTLGRDLSNDIVIQDPEVSRWHLQLLRGPDGYALKDLGSTNGTVLNGMRLIDSRPLKVFDTIELGTAVRLHYIYDTDDARRRLLNEDDAASEAGSDGAQAKRDTKEVLQLRFSSKRKTSRLGTGLIRGSLVDHIFVAYAREDWETVVAPMTIALQDAGMEIWVDQYLVQGGEDWKAAVEQALHECWLMILLISPEALESRYVRLAYRYFINREKPVIPLQYKPSESMPTELTSIESLPFDIANARHSYQRLIHAILEKRPS
ncbi:MAG: hypothetical protein CL610_11885 [Anaerolineaceae bacterium]|nr:hypothetical protein [Anaerolineaceae bacterium]